MDLNGTLYKADILQAYTDSMLNGTRLGIGAQQDKNALLFKIGDSTLRIPDWIGYAQVFRYGANNTIKTTDVLMDEFTQANVMRIVPGES